jgi:monovalent cation:H+ antiporter-2, CPA2 family
VHDLPLIGTIAAAFFTAWLLGLLTQRLGLSPIVGYILAGVVIGPSTPGFAADLKIAQQLAEVGVILLMFGVGMHFDVKDLIAVRRVAITGALGQSLVATLLGMALFTAFGFPMKTGFVVGMALAVASTVVLIRMLDDRRLIDSPEGHVAVGWLVVEDLFTVVVLVIIPIIGTVDQDAMAASPWEMASGIGWVFLKLGVLIAAVVVIGRRAIPWLLVRVARARSRELFTLTVLVFSIALAAGAYVIFGASMALGAFLAGMMVAQSPSSHQVAADALPLRDAFAVLFFVSVGMLFDPMAVLSEPLLLLGALGIVLVAKPLAALVLVWMLGHSTKTALTVAVGLAQIGEFSFILSDAARAHGLMPQAGHNVLIAAAILSITLNPLLFKTLPALEAFIQKRPRLWKILNRRVRGSARVGNISTIRRVTDAARVRKLAVVVGYGPVGQAVDRLLREAGIDTVIIDANIETVVELQKKKRNAVFGDASRSHILEQAGVRNATHLILAFPEGGERTAVIAAARSLSPSVRILVRARYLSEKAGLDLAGASAAVFEEAEAAVALARLVLTDTGASREVVDLSIRDLKLRLILENLSDLSGRTVRSVMVPWSRVRRLPSTASLQTVLGMVAKEHYSRWPVEGPDGKPSGYLLVKDLVGGLSEGVAWTSLVRPIRAVEPSAPIEPTLRLLQGEGATVCLVEDAGRPVGLFTIEDILEQVVGRIEDEYPRHANLSVKEALSRGAVLLDLAAVSVEEAIREMAAAIPRNRLPARSNVAEAALERERQIHTDVGLGVAMPHARCPDLTVPIVVFARSPQGIMFDPASAEPVRLIFLILTPAEQPEVQVFLLSQLARSAGDAAIRRRLSDAATPAEVLSILDGAGTS